MILPPGLPYLTLLGLWWRRRELKRDIVHDWITPILKAFSGWADG